MEEGDAEFNLYAAKGSSGRLWTTSLRGQASEAM